MGRPQRICCVCHQPIDDDQALLCVIFDEPNHHKDCTPRPDQTRRHPEGLGPVPEMSLSDMARDGLSIRALNSLSRVGIRSLSQLRTHTELSLAAASVGPKTINDVQTWMINHALSMLPDGEA